MRKKITPIERCIAVAGSQAKMVKALQHKGHEISPSTITYWLDHGVPAKWWPILDAVFGIESNEFFEQAMKEAKKNDWRKHA
jgi:hypothetical protein